MKRFKLTLVLLLSIVAMGCASEKKASQGSEGQDEDIPYVDPPTGAYVPPGDAPGEGPGKNWQSGATAELNFVSEEVLADYISGNVNSPRNARINVNLRTFTDNRTGRVTYGGTVTISYEDDLGFGNALAEGFFTSGHSSSETRYNVWLEKDGQTAYHGFFADHLGAIVLVIERPSGPDLGDGQSVNLWSGSVWFKNFDPKATYMHPPTRCWFVSRGPYDCRSWKSGSGVDTFRAILPDSGYRRLGTFDSLNLSRAFNNAEIVVSQP